MVVVPERETKQPKKIRPQSLSAIGDIDVFSQVNITTLPTPEDKLREMSRSQPITLVPIDVSGSGFNRQCELRASQRLSKIDIFACETKSLRKRRSRRQTVSGIPGHVFEEVNHMFRPSSGINLNARSASKERWERPRSMALDTYAPKLEKKRCKEKRRGKSLEILDVDEDESKLARSCSLRRSLRSLFKGKRTKSTDLWLEHRPESPEPPTREVGAPLTRSRSLPRSLKNLFKESVSRFSQNRSASTEGRLDRPLDDDIPSPTNGQREKINLDSRSNGTMKRSMSAHSYRPQSSTFIGGSSIDRRTSSLDRRRSSQHRHTSSLERNTSSLERRTSSLERRTSSLERKTSSLGRHNVPKQVAAPSVPARTSTTPSSTAMENTFTSAGGQHVHVNIPSKPWTKPFSKVKLRGLPEKIDKDDRQSSSGNISSSSTSTISTWYINVLTC